MPRTAAMEGAMFRVGVATLPAAPRFYRERRRCAVCSWATATARLARCLALGAWCHARRTLMRLYLRALLSEAVPVGALPLLARLVWWTPPFPRRRAWGVGVLLIELVLVVAALT